jgi:hypothetical protein
VFVLQRQWSILASMLTETTDYAKLYRDFRWDIPARFKALYCLGMSATKTYCWWGSEIFAIDAHCSHYHRPLAEGLVVGESIRCAPRLFRFEMASSAAATRLDGEIAYRCENREPPRAVTRTIKATIAPTNITDMFDAPPRDLMQSYFGRQKSRQMHTRSSS